MFAKRFRKPLTRRPSMVLEQLEERIVFDASGDAGAQDNPDHDQSESDQNPEASQDGSASVDGDTAESSDPVADILSTDLNVVLISNALDEIQALSDAVMDGAQVIVYDGEDGDLDSITDVLQELVGTYGGKIDHLAVLSHGEAGVLQLSANEQISAVDILSDASSWETLGALLDDGAVIDLYGCDIGQDTSGELLVSALSSVTGATVRASDDATGTGSGADWQLETTSGESDLDYLLDTTRLDDVDILLAIPDATSTIYGYTHEDTSTIIKITATDADAPDGLGIADYEFVLVSDTESGSVITTVNGAVVELQGTAAWDPDAEVYWQYVSYTPADDYCNDHADEDTWDTFNFEFRITPATPVYEQQTVIMESNGSHSHDVFDAQLADFDGDGDLDIFTLVEDGPNYFLMEWYENLGDDGSNWVSHTIALESYYLEDGDICLADMDGDGDLDVVMPLFNRCDGGVYGDDYYEPVWFENRIDEYPTTDSGWKMHEDGTRITRYSVHAADIDSDGDTDILTSEDGSLTWWERTDLGGYAGWEWTEHTIETGSSSYTSVTTADVDGDLDLDIVAASENGDAIVWWEQDAPGSLVKHTLAAGFDGACSVEVSDLDGDGDLDILGAAHGDDEIAWWEQTDSGWTKHTIDDSFDGASAVTAQDMDRDGDVDVTATAENSNEVSWWEQTDTGWVKHVIDSDLPSAGCVVVADIDQDQQTEVIAAGATTATGEILLAVYSYTDNWVSTPDYGTEHVLVADMDLAYCAHFADVDGDGDLDIIAGYQYKPYSTAYEYLVWFENDGGDASGWACHLIDRYSNNWLNSIGAGDIDGDGDLDVIITDYYADLLRVYYNPGDDGSPWEERNVTKDLSGPYGPTAVDMDGDGDLDITLSYSRRDADDSGWHSGWWANVNGDGTVWQEVIVEETGWFPAHLGGDVCLPVDLDGDGDLDFVTGREGQSYGTIEFWEYKDGSIVAEWVQHILQDDVFGCRYLAIADMDNDSDLDIVGVANGDGLVAWWENDGDYESTWTMHLIAEGLDSPGNLYVADFDLDGDMDVAAVSQEEPGALGWWQNVDGEGDSWTQYTIVENLPYNSYYNGGAAEIAGGDLDGDGRPELLVVGHVSMHLFFSSPVPPRSDQGTVQVCVHGTDDNPIGGDDEVTTDEDVDYTFAATDFTFNDPDNHTFSGIRIESLETEGDLEYKGTDVEIGDVITDLTHLIFSPDSDENGTPYATFTFTVIDSSGAYSDDTYTMTVNVTAVNDAPVADPQTVNAVEDVPLEITLTGDDGDADATQTLTYFLIDLPANGALYATQTDAQAGTNALTIGSITGSAVWYVTDSNDPADTSFTFCVEDDGGRANGGEDTSHFAATVTVNVTAVNDAPVADPQTVNAVEDVPLEITLTGDDGDADAAQTLTYFLDDFPVNGALYATQADALAGTNALTAGSITGSTVWYVTDSNDPGDTSFTFHVQDDGGTANDGEDTSPSATVTINVTAVNDTPVADPQTVNAVEDVPLEITLTGDDGDADAAQTLTYFLDDFPVNGALYATQADALAGTNALTAGSITGSTVWYVTDSNDPGDTSFTFHVQDDGGTANDGEDTSPSATVTVNVTAVNDEPVYSGPTSATTDEDVPVEIGPFTGADGDPEVDQSLTYWLKATGDLANGDLYRTAADAAARVNAIDLSGSDVEVTWGTSVWYMSDPDIHHDTSFQIYVTDDGGTDNGGDDTSPDYTVNITVEAVNDAPVITAPGAVAVNEDSFVAITGISVFDVDLAQDPSLELQVTLTVLNGTLTLGQTIGLTLPPGANGTAAMAFTGTLDDVNAALATLTYTPNADFHGADTLQIIVDDLGNSGKSAAIVVSQAVPIRVHDVIDHIPPEEDHSAEPGPIQDFASTVGPRPLLGELSSLFGWGGLPSDDSTTTGAPDHATQATVESQALRSGDFSSSRDRNDRPGGSDAPVGLRDFMALLHQWGFGEDFDGIRLVLNAGEIQVLESLMAQVETTPDHSGQELAELNRFPDRSAEGKTLIFNLDEMRVVDMLVSAPAGLGLDAAGEPCRATGPVSAEQFDLNEPNLIESLTGLHCQA